MCVCFYFASLLWCLIVFGAVVKDALEIICWPARYSIDVSGLEDLPAEEEEEDDIDDELEERIRCAVPACICGVFFLLAHR